MKKRIAIKKAKLSAMETSGSVDVTGECLAGELAKSVPAIQLAVEEVAEDNLALRRAIKQVADGQDSLRTLVAQEVGQLRIDLENELAVQALRIWCRELSPLVRGFDTMLASGDFSDAATTRQHIESMAMTLLRALGRMGIEKIPIAVGSDLFDSRVHDCVRACTQADSPLPDTPSRTIVRVEEAGYLVKGKVAMPAKVWVQKIEAEKEANA